MAKSKRKKAKPKKAAPEECKCITELDVEELAEFLIEAGENEDTYVRETLYKVSQRLRVLASDITPNMLTQLRDAGWRVAGCRDGDEGGGRSSHWLMIHPDGRYVSGGGYTDEEALEMIALKLGMLGGHRWVSYTHGR